MRHLGKIQGALAILVVLGFMGVHGLLVYAPPPASGMRDALMQMIGTLGTGFGLVLGYYFGSSSSSRAKDDMLAVALRSKAEEPPETRPMDAR